MNHLKLLSRNALKQIIKFYNDEVSIKITGKDNN